MFLKVTTKFNRYGNQTKSTGLLNVKNQIIVQKNLNFFDTKRAIRTTIREKNGNEGQTERSAAALSKMTETKTHPNVITIDDVVSAYQKAKQRLEATTSLM